MTQKPRDFQELEANALRFWPEEIAEQERNSSIIPKLIATQDGFISLLHIADSGSFAWKQILPNSAQLPANLFLKHLMVLSDIGGEKLMRFKKELSKIFTDTDGTMLFTWNGKIYNYKFQTLSDRKWSNDRLKVNGVGLARAENISPAIEDVANLILFGGLAIADGVPNEIIEKCIIGTLIGCKRELDTFVRQRYILVSRIIGGATSNALGNLAQQYVLNFLKNRLPKWDFSNKQIPNITHNQRTLLSFDIVAQSPNNNYCAIEVSFQVTTNSVIERKRGESKERQKLLNEAGHKIAYIIDGAGNLERTSAITHICQFSDCTVTLKDSELERLSEFLLTIDE